MLGWSNASSTVSHDSEWRPNSFLPKQFNFETPLNDNSLTPRSAARSFLPDRCNDKKRWVYNKKSLDDFCEATKDIKREKKFRYLNKRSGSDVKSSRFKTGSTDIST